MRAIFPCQRMMEFFFILPCHWILPIHRLAAFSQFYSNPLWVSKRFKLRWRNMLQIRLARRKRLISLSFDIGDLFECWILGVVGVSHGTYWTPVQ